MAEVRITFDGKEGRRCTGSVRFGIAPHDAPVENFPSQPSQPDGLGRMCKPHWTEYTRALRKAALARKAAISGAARPRTRAKKAAAKASAAKATIKPVKPAIRPVPKPAKTQREINAIVRRGRVQAMRGGGEERTPFAQGVPESTLDAIARHDEEASIA